MTIYTISPQTTVNSDNILIIMTQLIKNISNSIQKIFNINLKKEYEKMINIINDILNDYLKVYKFYDYGITNINVQIYNQNINTVLYATIKLNDFRYVNIYSNYNDFTTGVYNSQPKIIYQALTQQQKNELTHSIISGNFYFIEEINFVLEGINSTGILLKPKIVNCECNNNQSNSTQYNNQFNLNKYVSNNYVYVNTIYWY